MWHRLPIGARAWLGIELSPIRSAERWISGAGGFLGILCIGLVSRAALGDLDATLLVVGSMGASAVLLFAVPHGPLSQPWALIGGHLISAAIGVACARAVPHTALAAAIAVRSSIAAMHFLRCIHPPGGATALTAVIGGAKVHALGYGYLATPVALNVGVILATAIAVNWWFPWRRYPASAARGHSTPTPLHAARRSGPAISHSDLEYALHEIDSVLDVREQDLARVYDLALAHARTLRLEPWQIAVHRTYSNGRWGAEWAIRETAAHDPARDTFAWRVVAGADAGKQGTSTRAELAKWARYEVFRSGDAWERSVR